MIAVLAALLAAAPPGALVGVNLAGELSTYLVTPHAIERLGDGIPLLPDDRGHMLRLVHRACLTNDQEVWTLSDSGDRDPSSIHVPLLTPMGLATCEGTDRLSELCGEQVTWVGDRAFSIQDCVSRAGGKTVQVATYGLSGNTLIPYPLEVLFGSEQQARFLAASTRPVPMKAEPTFAVVRIKGAWTIWAPSPGRDYSGPFDVADEPWKVRLPTDEAPAKRCGPESTDEVQGPGADWSVQLDGDAMEMRVLSKCRPVASFDVNWNGDPAAHFTPAKWVMIRWLRPGDDPRVVAKKIRAALK